MTEPRLDRDLRVPPVGPWRSAVVEQVRDVTERVRAYRLRVPGRVDHLPGQHYVVRLSAPDGYTAARSYSVASPPEDPLVELAVERLDDGEVSSYLADVVTAGDELEVRGPVGGWFVWRGASPALLIGGGSGVVPLVAMVRAARARGTLDRLRVLAAARTVGEVPYAEELRAAGARLAASRAATDDRAAGRLRAADLDGLLVAGQTVFVCGSAGFAEAATRLVVAAGVEAGDVRVERFGPSSG